MHLADIVCVYILQKYMISEIYYYGCDIYIFCQQKSMHSNKKFACVPTHIMLLVDNFSLIQSLKLAFEQSIFNSTPMLNPRIIIFINEPSHRR